MRRWAPTALLCLLPTLTACGGAGTPSAPRTTTTAAAATAYTLADDQYHRIQIGLRLPAGVSFPADLPTTSDHYPPGSGAVTAQNYWLCAWLGALLRKNRQARAQLPKYLRMDAYSTALDPRARITVAAMIREARAGGTKQAAAFSHGTCGGPFYRHARPA